jgi:Acyl-CoA thioesterase N-terminal domain
MLTKTPHLFDDATRVTAGDSCWQGKTSPDYWAFVGPFGGCTAATILRALIDHPQRAGDPLSLTVNFCAPVAEGAFDLDVRLVKANRSSQHWCVRRRDAGDRRVCRAPPVLVASAGKVSRCRAVRAGARISEHADDVDAPV